MQRIQWALMILLFSTCSITAWSQQTSSSTTVPRLVRFSGTIKDVSGKQVTGVAGVTFALYKDQEGGPSLWLETQNAQLDATGHYTVMLGATKSNGLPTELFTSGEARWLGVQPAGQAEQPRVLLLSVPYALKAGDAETVGGLPPSAFMRSTPQQGASTVSSDAGNLAPALQPIVHGSGTLNFVPLWTGKSLLGSSILIQSGSKLGVGIDTPATTLDVNGAATIRGNETVTGTLNTSGTLTGQAGSFTANNGASVLSVFQQGNGAAVSAGFNTGIGVSGFSLATSGNTVGVQGIVASPTGTGVVGQGSTGVQGIGSKVAGRFTNLSGKFGLILQGTDKSGQTQFSVDNAGTIFSNGTIFNNGNILTLGALISSGVAVTPLTASNTTFIGDPGCGSGYAGIGFGGLAGCTNYSMIGDGISTFINSPGQGPIYFRNNNNNLMTLDRFGNLDVNGAVTAGTKDFKIDHPLDPSNKYLYHASVESSEMMNIYTDNVTTDAAGDAIVKLPDWFEALNGDFRYQLTVIGQFAQAIVASEIANRHFLIKTDKPNVKVSWQVSGVRHDAWATAHRLQVEEEKPAQERGHYLHPELFGAAQQNGIK